MKNNSLINKLSEYSPGKLPVDIFNKIAQLTVTPVVEVIASNDIGIFLIRREYNDLFWPNMFCLPGKIISAGQHGTCEDLLDNLVEQHNLNVIDSYSLSGVKLVSTFRGKELAVIYHIRLDKNHDNITLWDELDKINIISEHRDMIESSSLQPKETFI